MEKCKVLIQFLLLFRQSVDVLFFLYARRLRGYTATTPEIQILTNQFGGQSLVFRIPAESLEVFCGNE